MAKLFPQEIAAIQRAAEAEKAGREVKYKVHCVCQTWVASATVGRTQERLFSANYVGAFRKLEAEARKIRAEIVKEKGAAA